MWKPDPNILEEHAGAPKIYLPTPLPTIILEVPVEMLQELVAKGLLERSLGVGHDPEPLHVHTKL
jgi:hypothetical protein